MGGAAPVATRFLVDDKLQNFLYGYTHTPEHCKFSDDTTQRFQCVKRLLEKADSTVKTGILHAALRHGVTVPAVSDPNVVDQARENIVRGTKRCANYEDAPELEKLESEYITLRSEIAWLLSQLEFMAIQWNGSCWHIMNEAELELGRDRGWESDFSQSLEKSAADKKNHVFSILIHLIEYHPEVQLVYGVDPNDFNYGPDLVPRYQRSLFDLYPTWYDQPWAKANSPKVQTFLPVSSE